VLSRRLFLSTGLLGIAASQTLTATSADRFGGVKLVVGHMWTIKDPPSPAVRLLIRLINERHVCVSVFDIPVPPRYNFPKPTLSLRLLPFTYEAGARSLHALVGTGITPKDDFEIAYRDYRAANGGAFTFTVRQTIDLVLDAERPRKANA
jgi:hypothetical protein